MRVLIENANGALLDVGAKETVLLPLNPNERAAAFEALTGALALLAGFTKPGAKVAETDLCSTAKEQCPDGHKRGVVVPLR